MESRQHFILVHGACHGAWCWYKVATLLRSAGHDVTALDMTACGVHPKRVDEVQSFEEYSEPLLQALESLPDGEKAILVGHSFGGLSLALAMERFPQKTYAAVFASAALPRVGSPFSVVFEEFSKEIEAEPDFFLDTTFSSRVNSSNPREILHFGPEYLSRRLYQNCSPEDLTLAKMLVRPVNTFSDGDIMNRAILTDEKYNSVSRVYIVCGADNTWTAELQRLSVEKCPGTEMREIDSADHMPMLSKPKELFDHLTGIAIKYD